MSPACMYTGQRIYIDLCELRTPRVSKGLLILRPARPSHRRHLTFSTRSNRYMADIGPTCSHQAHRSLQEHLIPPDSFYRGRGVLLKNRSFQGFRNGQFSHFTPRVSKWPLANCTQGFVRNPVFQNASCCLMLPRVTIHAYIRKNDIRAKERTYLKYQKTKGSPVTRRMAWRRRTSSVK
jgi:hypothetical protein